MNASFLQVSVHFHFSYTDIMKEGHYDKTMRNTEIWWEVICEGGRVT